MYKKRLKHALNLIILCFMVVCVCVISACENNNTDETTETTETTADTSSTAEYVEGAEFRKIQVYTGKNEPILYAANHDRLVDNINTYIELVTDGKKNLTTISFYCESSANYTNVTEDELKEMGFPYTYYNYSTMYESVTLRVKIDEIGIDAFCVWLEKLSKNPKVKSIAFIAYHEVATPI